MKNNKLPNIDKNTAFVAAGSFFLNTLILSNSHLGLKFSEGANSLQRISRFNQRDLQNYIQSLYSDKVLFFSGEYDYKNNPNWAYIKRGNQADESSLRALVDIFGVDSVAVFFLNFENSDVVYFDSKRSRDFQSVEVDIESVKDISKIKNILLDPVAWPSDYEVFSPVLNSFGALVKSMKEIPDLVFFVGEFVWASECEVILEIFLKKLRESNVKDGCGVVFDKVGYWEAFLSEFPTDNILKALPKREFVCDYYLKKIAKQQVLDIEIENEKKRFYLEEKAWKQFDFGRTETIYGLATKSLIVGNGSKLLLNKRQENKRSTLRKDLLLEYHFEDYSFQLLKRNSRRIKVFDYADPEGIQRVKLDVIENEKIRESDQLARYRDSVGLLDKYFRTPITGRVDLSDLKKGVIRVVSNESRITDKFDSYYKLRARYIWGPKIFGEYGKEVVFVSKLDKKKFDSLVEKQVDAVIADCIDLNFLRDVVDFDLGSVVTIVVVHGFEEAFGDGIWRILKKGTKMVLDSESRSVYIQAIGSMSISETTEKYLVKPGKIVRLVHEKYWGKCAKIIRQTDGYFYLSGEVPLHKIEKVNTL